MYKMFECMNLNMLKDTSQHVYFVKIYNGIFIKLRSKNYTIRTRIAYSKKNHQYELGVSDRLYKNDVSQYGIFCIIAQSPQLKNEREGNIVVDIYRIKQCSELNR